VHESEPPHGEFFDAEDELEVADEDATAVLWSQAVADE
jgi:hypothetical protein